MWLWSKFLPRSWSFSRWWWTISSSTKTSSTTKSIITWCSTSKSTTITKSCMWCFWKLQKIFFGIFNIMTCSIRTMWLKSVEHGELWQNVENIYCGKCGRISQWTIWSIWAITQISKLSRFWNYPDFNIHICSNRMKKQILVYPLYVQKIF